ncbi:hypothetical protein EST38_g2182 [Candolleomyces aberdarensis]|uniref:Uncharacterized protein n=1 Tax=Candolleomyces aberdarensis TaxID=2316362 RepID=A0A4Q2DXE5_9AGAR|nr:hypothetical protein EST38_g2182 [Candolleomyces aberdarensis]
MSAAWATQLNAKKQEQAAHNANKAARNRANRAKSHQVTLVLFDVTGTKWQYSPLQDIFTWPVLQLSAISGLVGCLGVSMASELEVYAGCHSGHPLWSDLNYIMDVKTNQFVYLHPVGVDIDLSLLCNKAMQPTACPTVLTPALFSFINLSNYPAATPELSTKCSVIDLDNDSDTDMSPSKRCCPADNIKIVNVSVLGNADDIWTTGAVFCPLMSKPWPHAMYVWDTAKGFELLSGTSGEWLSQQFPQVFPGHKFSSTTYHHNCKFWDELPLET